MSISDSGMSQTLREQDLQRLRSLSASRPLLVFGVVQRPADDAERLWLLFDAQLLVGCGRAGKCVVCQVLNQVLIAALFFLVLDSTERQSVTKGSHLTRGSPQDQWMGTSMWSNQTNDTAIAVDEHIMIHWIFVLNKHLFNPLGPRAPITTHSFALPCNPSLPGSGRLADNPY